MGTGDEKRAALVRLLLLPLPRRLRERFSADLVELHRDLYGTPHGWGSVVFWTRLAGDALFTGVQERWAALGSPGGSGPAPATPPPRLSRGRARPGSEIIRSLRYAVRALARQPAFTVVAAASLALGVGANAAIFSVANAIFFKPLPFREPERLVAVWEWNVSSESTNTIAPANYLDWRKETSVFEDVAAYNITFPSITGDGAAERVMGAIVAAHFFDLLGVRPALGTGFLPEHGEPGTEHVVLLSHALWQRRYGSDPGILGRAIRLNGTPYTVLGVMPSDYRQPEPSFNQRTELWIPLALDEQTANRGGRWLRSVARLAPGVELPQAKAHMRDVGRRMAEAYPETNEDRSVEVVDLRRQLFGDARPALLVLLAAAGFVLLVVCVNVANLVLARGQRKQQEFAVRASLGANRRDLVGQVMVESVLIALLGGGAGIALVAASSSLIEGMQARHLTVIAALSLDARVVSFTLGVSLLAALIFGLLPAIRASKLNLREILATGSARVDRGRHGRRSREVLISVEMALTTVLLIAAALLGRSFQKMVAVPTGFAAENVLSFEAILPADRYGEAEDILAGQDRMLAALEAVPGVEGAALVSDLPFTPWNMSTGVLLEGEPVPEGPLRGAEYRVVSPDYFAVLGIPFVSGAPPEGAERAGGVERVVVNEAMAERFWPGEDPLGRRFYTSKNPEARPFLVGGVVRDVLDDGFTSRPEPRMYWSYRDHTWRSPAVVVRAATNPRELLEPARRAVVSFDPDVAVSDLQTFSALLGATVSDRQGALVVMAAFSLLTLLLAAVGIYGVMAYSVGERTREIGLRKALGAQGNDLIRMVLRHTLTMVGVGMVAGAGASVAVGFALSSLLFGVSPLDPLTYLTAVALLVAVALLGAVVPARRAVTIEPLVALRNE